MTDQRPRISQRAREILEEYKRKVAYQILHEAEGRVLQRGRTEIGEDDVEKAAKAIVPRPSSSRKWCIRILVGLILSLLLIQFQTFRQLTNVPFELQIQLYFPSLILLMWIFIFSYIFREELI